MQFFSLFFFIILCDVVNVQSLKWSLEVFLLRPRLGQAMRVPLEAPRKASARLHWREWGPVSYEEARAAPRAPRPRPKALGLGPRRS